ncbi:hypothetical protein H5410_056447 [Solanum commersonii]|uniref:Uncharacterized protein n=1 Tax=Solanum commersonii TaxID=4109 RepID=A0A9J5WK95_SOLCO|nr:hypothetical protein H5410_056447 [Solanum commersonii]
MDLLGDPDIRSHFCQFFLCKSIKALAMELVGLDKKIDPFSRSNNPRNLSYGVGWSGRSMDLLVIQISDVSVTEIFYGHPSRP